MDLGEQFRENTCLKYMVLSKIYHFYYKWTLYLVSIVRHIIDIQKLYVRWLNKYNNEKVNLHVKENTRERISSLFGKL